MRRFVFLLLLVSPALLHASDTVSPSDAVRYAHLRSEIYSATDRAKIKPALEEAVKIYSQDGDLWWRLAQARLQARELDSSIEAYQNALRLGGFGNKFKASAMYDVACAYALKGDKEKSFDWLQKSLDLGFRDLQHLQTDTDLDSLHADKRWEELAGTKDVTKMSRDEGWRYDLWLLNREVTRIHYNPYSKFSKAEDKAWVKKLNDEIPKMTDNQIKVAFMKFMRRLNDGHSSIRPSRDPGYPMLPLQPYWFEEGMMIVAADPSLKDLLGAKIVSVAGKPIDEVIEKLDDVIPQDNHQDVKSIAPRFIINPGILHGEGLMPDKNEIELGIVDASGQSRTVKLQGKVNADPKGWETVRDASETAAPLYLKHRDKPYWFEPLPDQKAVYMQYNAVRNDPAEDTARFAARLCDYIEKNDVDTLIVDVRWNGGGNSFLNLPIVNAIIGCKKIQEPGHLFVITGRQTFSAAQNFTTDLDRACTPIFVGEPTGSCPNFVGETVMFKLPFSKMEGSISDLYWQRSWPMDSRIWISPDLPAAPSYELFKANRDPAMEAIAAYRKG